MNILSSILFWAGILMLTDGSLALLFQDKWQKLVSGLNIRRVAFMEIGVAFALLVAHYILS